MIERRRFRFAQLFGALLRPFDPVLSLILVCLLAYAVLVMGSASPDRIESQLLHIAMAAVGMWIVASMPPQRLLSLGPILYIIGVALLVAVHFFGEISKGAQRWLDIGGVMRVQPSEVMKIAMPLGLAWFFQKREGSIGIIEFLVAVLLLAVPAGLIAKQPDLGTAVLVTAAGAYVIFFAGLPWKLIVPAAIIGALAIGILAFQGEELCSQDRKWPGLKDYQKDRICTLVREKKTDPRGKDFHIIQATITIGSGGVSGKGWRKGTQTQLEFLPERHTDFVFAALAEEFGFTGAMILLVLYIALLVRGFFIAATAPDLGSRLLAGAMTMVFFTYLFVNIGMVSGILPVVGIPLPFISYGGTALVTLCLGVGILMSVRGHRAER